MPLSKTHQWRVLRELTAFGNDPDWVLTQDAAGAKAAGLPVTRDPAKRQVSAYVGFYDAAGQAITGSRGSFSVSPILINGDDVVDGGTLAGAIGWRRYVLDDTQFADFLSFRFTSITPPAGTAIMRVYAEALAL